jgi:AcrR family transcriptional regulator
VRTYDRRLQTLLATAARTFAERGFHATSMRDLSRASGMSLAGIYHYVKSKDELLYLIQDRCFAQVIAGARAAVAANPEPRARLAGFIQHHVIFFAAHMEEMKVLSHEADQLAGTWKSQIRRRKREYVSLLLALLEDVEAPRITPQTAAFALFGMVNWIYTWYHPAGPISPQRLGDEMGRLFLDGFVQSTTSAGLLAAAPGG